MDGLGHLLGALCFRQIFIGCIRIFVVFFIEPCAALPAGSESDIIS